MNFFKSILLEDTDPPVPKNDQESETNYPSKSGDSSPSLSQDEHDPKPDDGVWSFGGFMKTFASRSESVIETYRRDLEEFRSGLQKETELFKEIASRAVKDLPSSIEVGASVAQGVIKSTAEIISHGKDALLVSSDSELDASDVNNSGRKSLESRRYSRFESQLRLVQGDVNTYCEEPEDLNDYNKWKQGFVLEEHSNEIESLVEDNGDCERIYKMVVPSEVDHSTFWCRLFYRVHKLKQQEDVRSNLVKRAISIDDDEELTWDVDDDEEESQESNVASQGNENKEASNKELLQIVKEESPDDKSLIGNSGSGGVEADYADSEKKASVTSDEDEGNVVQLISKNASNEKVISEGTSSEVNNEELILKSDEKIDSEGKADHNESCKESDISVVSTQPSSREEEDLEWDEIEDLGSNDEKKVSQGGSPNRTELRKRLSAAEDDEDLSWDIEDDDEPPAKA